MTEPTVDRLESYRIDCEPVVGMKNLTQHYRESVLVLVTREDMCTTGQVKSLEGFDLDNFG